MTDEVILEASAPQPAFVPLGEVLAEARAAKKLTQQDVSNHLRFSLKQVAALESNDFAALPDAMITRGFIRNYARYLNIDAEPLLESYRARMPSKTPSAVSVQSSMYQVMSGKDNQPWLKYILGSILVLLFLLGWIFYVDYLPKPAKPTDGLVTETPVISQAASDSVPQQATTVMALPEVALPAAERAPDATTTTTEVVIGTPETAAATVPVPATPPAAALAPGAATPTTAPTSSIPATATPQPINAAAPTIPSANTQQAQQAAAALAPAPVKTLSFSVTAKTWINITDKNGKVLYETILPAGGAGSLDGTPPFRVTVGNAKATMLTYKGQAVNLQPSTTENNVARIKLE